MHSVESLLIAARQGDKKAEEQLFSKLHARISRIVQYKLQRSSKHPLEATEDGKDIVLEIMQIISTKYKTARFEHGFMAWAHAIVWRRVGNYIRSRRGQLSDDIEWDNMRDDAENLPDRILEQKELDEIIQRSLKRLDAASQEIIGALLSGHIREYIAERKQQQPEGTVYSQIHRCRERFQLLLTEEGFEA